MKIKMINLILVPTYRKLLGVKNHVFITSYQKGKGMCLMITALILQLIKHFGS